MQIELAVGPFAVGQFEPGRDDPQDEHDEDDVEQHAELDDERDPTCGEEGDGGDPVVDDEEPDDLRDGTMAGEQDEEAHEHQGEPSGDRVGGGAGVESDQGAAHGIREGGQTGCGEEPADGVDRRGVLPVRARAGDGAGQDPRQDDALEGEDDEGHEDQFGVPLGQPDGTDQ